MKMQCSTSDPYRQNCNAPLSIVLLFSQYCMVNSLIKRLELLFLWVFAWPKASRTQYTCVWHQSKRVMCSEYVLLLSFFNNKNLIDMYCSISRADKISSTLIPLSTTRCQHASINWALGIHSVLGWSESELTQISATSRWLHCNTALVLPHYTLHGYLLNDWLTDSRAGQFA